jgi:uncharacterized membrane protein YdfJ with MMPL/SSD domain
MQHIEPALRSAAPPGASISVTGFEQIQTVGAASGSGGPSVLLETLIGAVGALAVLLFVYGSAVAIVPLLIAVPSILTTFVLVLGLTHVTDVSFLVEYLVAVMRPGCSASSSCRTVSAQHRRGCSADSARRDRLGPHAAAGDPRRVGPALDKHRIRGSTTFSRRWEQWAKLIRRRPRACPRRTVKLTPAAMAATQPTTWS